MKILFLITRADTVGGAQVHVKDLAKALIDAGHTVLVITGLGTPYRDALQHQQIPTQCCPQLRRAIGLHDVLALCSLRSLMQQFEPDLVSVHSSKAGILGRLLCKILNYPCVFTAHGWAFTTGVPQPTRTIYQFIERLVTPFSNRIICVSEYDRQLGIAAGMNPKKLQTIHNGMPEIADHLRAKPGATGPVSLVMIARFDQQKDHHTLLTAIQSLSNVYIQLIGDGPKLLETRSLAEDLEIGSRVEFLGFQADVTPFLAKAKIFALISH
jgi:glycosyltransferase involved in cell wall biosynthesis